MAMARHTTQGEDNSKEGTNETRTNKRIKKEKKQAMNKQVMKEISEDSYDSVMRGRLRRLLYFYM